MTQLVLKRTSTGKRPSVCLHWIVNLMTMGVANRVPRWVVDKGPNPLVRYRIQIENDSPFSSKNACPTRPPHSGAGGGCFAGICGSRSCCALGPDGCHPLPRRWLAMVRPVGPSRNHAAPRTWRQGSVLPLLPFSGWMRKPGIWTGQATLVCNDPGLTLTPWSPGARRALRATWMRTKIGQSPRHRCRTPSNTDHWILTRWSPHPDITVQLMWCPFVTCWQCIRTGRKSPLCDSGPVPGTSRGRWALRRPGGWGSWVPLRRRLASVVRSCSLRCRREGHVSDTS